MDATRRARYALYFWVASKPAVACTAADWIESLFGTPDADNLARCVARFEDSLRPGGANAGLAAAGVTGVQYAQIYDRFREVPVTTWSRPKGWCRCQELRSGTRTDPPTTRSRRRPDGRRVTRSPSRPDSAPAPTPASNTPEPCA